MRVALGHTTGGKFGRGTSGVRGRLYWFAMQLLTGLPQLSALRPEISDGVAAWANVGGFAAGALLIRFFARQDLVIQRRSRRTPQRAARRLRSSL